MRNAVIVADMQRGFMSPEGTLYCGDEARQIIPRVRTLVEHEAAAGSLIIFTVDTHAPDDKEFAIWPPHCIKGTSETEIIPELADLADRHTIMPKRRYSAFFDTNLEERLAGFRPDRLLLAGDCTDICVLHTVADARNRDYPVTVFADCVTSFDPEGHTWALGYMAKILGAQVIDSYPQVKEKNGG
jgi:nicotinamidase/pyrazinamidase